MCREGMKDRDVGFVWDSKHKDINMQKRLHQSVESSLILK